MRSSVGVAQRERRLGPSQGLRGRPGRRHVPRQRTRPARMELGGPAAVLQGGAPALARVLALIDDAAAAGQASFRAAERLKASVAEGALSSRQLAELTMGLLLGDAGRWLAAPARGPSGGPAPAPALPAVGLEAELAEAWEGFAAVARGLTSRPWPEVERAFLQADSEEAAEARAVAAGTAGAASWLLDIDQERLERLPDAAGAYGEIVSRWQRWCGLTKALGGLRVAQQVLTERRGSWQPPGRAPLSPAAPSPAAALPRSSSSPLRPQTPAACSTGSRSPADRRGNPAVERKSPRARPRLPARTRLAPKSSRTASPGVATVTPSASQSSGAEPDVRSGFKALLAAAGMTEEEFVRQHLRVQTEPRRAAEEGQPPARAAEGLPPASRGRRTVPPREQSEAPEEARAQGPTPRRTPPPHSVAHPGSGSSSGSGGDGDSDSDEAVDGPAHHTIAESVKMAAGAASTPPAPASSKPPAPTRAVAAVSPAPAAPISKEKRKVRPLGFICSRKCRVKAIMRLPCTTTRRRTCVVDCSAS